MILTYVMVLWIVLMCPMAEGLGDCLTPYCFCNSDLHFVSCNEIKTSKLPKIEDQIKKNTIKLEIKDSMIRLLSLPEHKWPMLKHLNVSGAIAGSSTIISTTITAQTAFVPDSSDGGSLDTTSLEFSDLFLADEGYKNSIVTN